MTRPTKLTALTDPESMFFELVDERPGFTEDEAYAFLAGADAATFGLPKITVAGWQDQLRAPSGTDEGGQWVDSYRPIGPDILQVDGKSVFTDTKLVATIFTYPGIRPYSPESDALNDYVDEDVSKPLNRRLMTGQELKPKQVKVANGLSKAIAKFTTEYDTVVWRGMRVSEDDLKRWTTRGSDNVHLAFLSTTSNEEDARQYQFGQGVPVRLKIRVPKGTHAAPGLVDVHGNYDGVGELIFERGANLRTVHAEEVDGSWMVTVDLTPADAGGTLTAAAEAHTGAMVALVPSDVDAKRLKLAGGEPIGQLHTTLVYLGEADDISDDARAAIVSRLRALVVDAPLRTFDAEGFAVSVFNPPGHVKDDGKQRDTCLVLQLGGAEIDRVHTLVANATGRIDGLQLPEQHRPWVPHITLIYTDDFAAALEKVALRVGPVTFDALRIAFGGDVVDVPLGGVS